MPFTGGRGGFLRRRRKSTLDNIQKNRIIILSHNRGAGGQNTNSSTPPASRMEEDIMFEKIQSYLAAQLDISADEITRDTTFESLGIDSLDTVEMVMDLESELGVDLEMEEKLNTVGELVDFVESRLD